MQKNRFARAGLGAFLTMALVVSACGDPSETNTPPTAKELVDQGSNFLGEGKWSDAESKCLLAEQKDDTLAEAKYCVMLANVGALVDSVSAILSLVAGQLGPQQPYASAAGFDVKQIVGTILAEIEQQMANIDTYAFKLAGMDNPKFTTNSFPLRLDVGDILSITGSSGLQVSENLSLNLKGTWDKSEVVILGATMNGVQAILDYLLAHKLKLDKLPGDFGDISTEFVATFLLDNPNLLIGDEKDTARLTGDDTRKGMKNDVLAALSFLLGRDAELARVSPVHGGLREAIKQSAADAKADPDIKPVVVWTDADTDGIPETVGLPALDDLKDDIKNEDGTPVIEETTFDVPGEVATWEAAIAKGEAIMANIEADGGSAVAIDDLLEQIRKDHNDGAETVSTLRIATLPVPQAVALSPGSFLADPKVLADLVPYYFEYTLNATDGTVTTGADLAWEVEMFASAATNQLEKLGMDWAVTIATSSVGGLNEDFEHFDYSKPKDIDGTGTPKGYGHKSVTDYIWGDLTAPVKISADGVTATTNVPNLYYIGLQSPSIAGALLVNPTLEGGTYEEATLATFNTTLAKLFEYYCINTDLASPEGAEITDAIDNAKQPCD